MLKWEGVLCGVPSVEKGHSALPIHCKGGSPGSDLGKAFAITNIICNMFRRLIILLSVYSSCPRTAAIKTPQLCERTGLWFHAGFARACYRSVGTNTSAALEKPPDISPKARGKSLMTARITTETTPLKNTFNTCLLLMSSFSYSRP